MALGRQAYANPTRKIKQPGATLCHCIKTAWEWIHPELVAKGEYCIPDLLDGTDNRFGGSSEQSCVVVKRVILMGMTDLQGVKAEKQPQQNTK